MSKNIIEEIGETEFGLLVDSTADISGCEIVSVCVRYVTQDGKPVEHLIGVMEIFDTTGEGYFQVIKEWAQSIGLRLEQCVGFSFDGASNMRSENKGLQATAQVEGRILPQGHLYMVLCSCAGPLCKLWIERSRSS